MLELYACLAKAWIEGQDAVPNKLAAYYMYMGEARKASTAFSTIKLIMYEHFSTVKGWNKKIKPAESP